METFRKTIKKIAALTGGAVMVGAAMAGAFAALDTLPQPFISSAGVFDSYLVVGTMGWNPNAAFNAAATSGLAEDLATGIDVGAAFAQKATTAATGGATSSVSEGYLIRAAGNDLNYHEDIQDIKAAFSTDELSLLGDGNYKETKGVTPNDVTYTQKLEFPVGAGEVIFGQNTEDDNKPVDTFVKLPDTAAAGYTYKIHFDDPVEFGNANAAETKTDFKSTKLTVLGQTYTVSDAKEDGAGITDLTLLSGSVTATQGEYTTQTYTVNGKAYEVEVLIVSDTTFEAKFKINGETTDALLAGDTYELADGTDIGVNEVMPNEGSEAAGADQVTFFLGANKLLLKDANGDVKLNDADFTGYTVTSDMSDVNKELSDISIKVVPDDPIFMKTGESFKDPVFGKWGLYFTGMEKTTEAFAATGSSDTGEFEFKNNAGKTVDIPVWSTGVGGDALWGDEDHDGFLEAAGGATLDHNMILVNTETCDGTGAGPNNLPSDCEGTKFLAVSAGGEAHVLEITKIKNPGAVNAAVSIKDLTSDKVYEDKPALTNGGAGSPIDLDFMTINLNAQAPANGDIGFVTINGYAPTGAVSAGAAVTAFKTDKNAEIQLSDLGAGPGGVAHSSSVYIFSDGGNGDDDSFNFNVDADGDVIMDHIVGVTMTSEEKNSDTKVGVYDTADGQEDYWGTMWTYESKDKYSLDIVYPEEQAIADLYLAPAGATTTASTSGAVNVNYINAATGIAKTDADFATAVPTKNVILIGGPTVNQLVSDLAAAGKTYTSTEWATMSDKAIVQTVEDAYGTYDALIIAGYEAKDTKLAGKVVASKLLQNQFTDKLKGQKVTLGTAGASTVNEVTFA